jgi:hypothetical protein
VGNQQRFLTAVSADDMILNSQQRFHAGIDLGGVGLNDTPEPDTAIQLAGGALLLVLGGWRSSRHRKRCTWSRKRV